MIAGWSEAAEAAFRGAAKVRLVPDAGDATVLERAQIEQLLPHRDPFLLVHRVTHVDFDRGRLAARYRLSEAAAIFAGHFPGRPMYPGVLQIEMVGQAGLLLRLLQDRAAARVDRKTFLTHVLGARFLRAVGSDGEVEIAVTGIDEDPLFAVGVGQILHRGEICAVAAVSCVIEEE